MLVVLALAFLVATSSERIGGGIGVTASFRRQAFLSVPTSTMVADHHWHDRSTRDPLLQRGSMAILTDRFDKALEAIEPSATDKANAPLAHMAVRDVLTSARSLKDWGLKPVLIGSYKRDVSIRRVKDVDVFCRMESIGPDVKHKTVFNAFFEVLDAEFGRDNDGKRRVRRQARSLQVAFPEYDGLYVDAVPARQRWDGYWEIPAKDSEDWQTTNPEELTSLKTAMNDSFSGLYVPGVKLLRQTRRHILDSRPGGLFVELCFYDACKRGVVGKDNQTIVYVTGLEAIAAYLENRVNWNTQLPDPTMPGRDVVFRATDNQWENARDRFDSASKKARAAYKEKDPGLAAVAFRELLGTNGDGDTVFPMPAGYNEDGTKRAAATLIVPGGSMVPAGDRRFG
jgi:hypothetical protein